VRDVMVSGGLTKVYVQRDGAGPQASVAPPDDGDAAGSGLIVAAHPTRRGAPAHAIGARVVLRWNDADAVVLAEPGP
jgi:hypothetical protein